MILPEELEDIAFLSDSSAEHRTQVALMAQLKEYPAGTELFRQGQRCGCVYIVLRGTVGIEIEWPGHNSTTIQKVGRGELLGWSPLLHRERMTATARTLSPCRLAALDAAEVLRHSTEDPRFGMEFLRRTALALSDRLAATRQRLSEQMFNGFVFGR